MHNLIVPKQWLGQIDNTLLSMRDFSVVTQKRPEKSSSGYHRSAFCDSLYDLARNVQMMQIPRAMYYLGRFLAHLIKRLFYRKNLGVHT